MFRSRTVFVIGAGASVELGLPTGFDLKKQIREVLALDRHDFSFTDPVIQQSMLNFSSQSPRLGGGQPLSAAIDAAKVISMNMPLAPSIDTFLDSNQHDEYIVATGKVAIARCILKEEAKSALRIENPRFPGLPLDDERLTSSYLIPLWEHLVARVSPSTVGTIFNNVYFIVFNYDRCLEQFLFQSLQSYFSLSRDAAASLVEAAAIIHPYGKIGGLPWQKDRARLSFGSEDDYNVLQVALELNTFTESAADGLIRDIKGIMRNAESLILLGFGFLEENVELLSSPTSIKRVFLTTHLMSPTDKAAALETTGRMIGRRIHQNYEIATADLTQAYPDNHTCALLFANNRLRVASPAPV